MVFLTAQPNFVYAYVDDIEFLITSESEWRPDGNDLRELAVKKGIIQSDYGQVNYETALQAKETISIWIMAPREDKEKIIQHLMDKFSQNGVEFRQPVSYYVNAINGVLYQSLILDNIFSMQKKGIGTIFKTVAILDGDFDNGQDKRTVLFDHCGPDIFKQYCEKQPLRFERIFGRELVKDDDFVDTLEVDFDRDGVIDKATLIKKESEDSAGGIIADATLVVESKGEVYSQDIDDIVSMHFSGIEELIVSNNIPPFIVVSTHEPGSAHAWSIMLYQFDGKKITQEANIFSDGPSIVVKDVDDDGNNEIVVDTRDYKHHPVQDRFLETLKYDGKKWNTISIYETRTKKFINRSFSGEWVYAEEEYHFFLYLEQDGNKVNGGYSAVVGRSGNKIDGIPGESENISGLINEDVAEITFKSDWGGMGKAKIIYKDDKIEWEIIEGTEQGQFYCPRKVILTRRDDKLETTKKED